MKKTRFDEETWMKLRHVKKIEIKIKKDGILIYKADHNGSESLRYAVAIEKANSAIPISIYRYQMYA